MPLNRELILNYADGLYAAASAQGIQHRVREDMERLGAFVREHQELVRRMAFAFRSAGMTAASKKALLGLLEEAFGLSPMSSEWLKLVAKNGRFDLLGYLAEAFVEVYRTREKRLVAVVETAFPLPPERLGELKTALERELDASVELVPEERPELIAGLRVRTAGKIWDMSISGMLERFRQRRIASGGDR